MNRGGETDSEMGEDDLSPIDQFEEPDEGPGIWFVLALIGGVVLVSVILGMLILWLIGIAETPSPLLR
jgi:hypothetical protein